MVLGLGLGLRRQSGKSCNKGDNSDCSESSNIFVYHFNKASEELWKGIQNY